MSNLDVCSAARAHGFEFVRAEEVEEIAGKAWILTHTASGARLIFLECDDNDKSFSIAFKTPPQDSTGVFHILEHSVLCGSEKYPVKEPFVNLLKSSMQTFLNAMTFPDKTVYPVASTNEKDLENLMRIYLDAVFNPRIYTTPQIFEQEGWHKSISHDARHDEKKALLDYSGVVYNEMKGALSDPDSILFDALCERLYPGSAYEFESGGKPSDIPNLTYEKFIDTHARHYSPSNSYISLYGNLDIDHFLKIIDEEYLMPVQAKIDSGERPAGNPNALSPSCQALTEVFDVEMEIKPENAVEGIAFKLGSAKDILEIQQINLLMDVLMSTNVSPLKAKLLETGVADDFYASLIEPVSEPALMIACQGIKSEDALKVMEETIFSVMTGMVGKGFDHELIEAEINHAEFAMREHNFGTSDGVISALDLLASWLYDEENPLANVKFEKIFADMRKSLDEGGFEKIAKRLILENKQVARVRVRAVDKVATEEKLPVTSQEAEEISKHEEELHNFQSMPDMPEDLAKLPYLTKDDIDKAPAKLQYEVQNDGVQTLIAHRNLLTKGISYFNLYIDCSELSMEDLPYLSLLAKYLCKFDTQDYTAEELDFQIRKNLGRFAISSSILGKPGEGRPYLAFSVSCLKGNETQAAKILNTVLNNTSFNNLERGVLLMNQMSITMDQGLVNSGHLFAMRRADAQLSKNCYLKEMMSGIMQKKFIEEQLQGGNASVEAIFERFGKILDTVVKPENVIFSYSSSDDVAQKFLSGVDFGAVSTTPGMAKNSVKDFEVAIFSTMPGMKKKEAFAVKSDVTFAAARNDFSMMPGMNGGKVEYSGKWPLVSRILSYDYLWNTVRVQGGAYGCGFNARKDGVSGFYSYRDPNVTSTLQRFSEAGKWIADFAPGEREFDGFIVSTIAGFDKPEKPSAAMSRGEAQFFEGTTEEERQEIREQALSCTLRDIQDLAPAITNIAKDASICVIGNEDTLRASGEFDEVIAL